MTESLLRRILVPLDEGPSSHAILTLARPLLVSPKAEVHLLRVIGPEDEEAPGGSRAAVDAAKGHLESVASRLEARGWRARVLLREGYPADEILAVAEEIDATLIAMASHGRSGVARWIHGSVTERVLSVATTPLLLAGSLGVIGRPGWDEEPGSPTLAHEATFKRILVPIDGHPLSNEVIPRVAEIARLEDSEVVLLHVAKPGAPGVPASAYDRALAILPGVRTRVEVVEGSPAASILDVAARGLFDLVAMTTHSRQPSVWPFGSVAGHVLRCCPAPLLVVRTAGA